MTRQSCLVGPALWLRSRPARCATSKSIQLPEQSRRMRVIFLGDHHSTYCFVAKERSRSHRLADPGKTLLAVDKTEASTEIDREASNRAAIGCAGLEAHVSGDRDRERGK